MYVITGASGRVGSAIAATLIEAGQPVRVVVRRPDAAAEWTARGAQAVVADLRDRLALARALDGATGAFVMLPFDLGATDPAAHEDAVVGAVSRAVADAAVPHVVMLSSGGADLPAGTGPILGLRAMEQALRRTGAVLTLLRPGHFQEKVGDVLDAARHDGVYPVFASSADVPVPMNATRDIAAVAAHALLNPPAATEVVDVVGPSYTEREVARLLGEALGRTLEVAVVPEEAWAGAFVEAGFRPVIAEGLADLYRADERGDLGPRGDRAVRVHGDLRETIRQVVAARPT